MAHSYIYVLYLDDPLVTPVLQLLRNICEPASKSKPHVTVYGPISRGTLTLQNEHFPEIELVEPGLFTSSSSNPSSQNTVFIRCDLLRSAWLHYKPDYITSLPHITLYDGQSNRFAHQVADVLREYSWHIKVKLPHNASLKRILLRRPSQTKNPTERNYSVAACILFRKIIGQELTFDTVSDATESTRLQWIKSICDYLHQQAGPGWLFHASHMGKLEIQSDHALQTLEQIKDTYKGSATTISVQKGIHAEALAKNPRSIRRLLGQFLTPPELAIEIVRHVRLFAKNKLDRIDFGDPCIGSGTFFAALQHEFPPETLVSAVGIEIDKTIASITMRVWGGKRRLRVVNDDFFTTSLRDKRNLILSNPPYVRHQYLSNVQKRALQKRVYDELGITVSGRSSLYLYFMMLCHNWMQSDAVACWLVSSEFMAADYGSALREYLTTRVSLHVIHRFDPKDLQFDGVLAASCIVLFTNTVPNPQHSTRYSIGGGLSTPLESRRVSISDLRSLAKWPETMAQFDVGPKPALTLSDFFSIQRGIATGANDFFILTLGLAKKHHFPRTSYRPILPSPRFLNTNIVNTDRSGHPLLEPKLVLLDCDLPETTIRAQYPGLWKYLSTAKELGVRDGFLVKNRHLWYKQETRAIPMYLCTYMGRGTSTRSPFRFILNRSDAVATNVYLLLFPKESLLEQIRCTPGLDERILLALNSIRQEDLRNSGRVYGGGLYKLEPKELGQVNATMLMEFAGSDFLSRKSREAIPKTQKLLPI
ncbi:MAG: hypothetical protein PCFJNLEI_04045 [Verrucomicrobiae bacterium]|nr:hypothetical protein [Verrucomicrobiae bacterium]